MNFRIRQTVEGRTGDSIKVSSGQVPEGFRPFAVEIDFGESDTIPPYAIPPALPSRLVRNLDTMMVTLNFERPAKVIVTFVFSEGGF